MDRSRSDEEKSLEGQAQEQLAETLYATAELHDARGDYYQATKLYHESMQLRLFVYSSKEGSADDSKVRHSNMVHCGMCLVGMGGVYLKQEDYVEAHKVFNKALNFCKAHGVQHDHVIMNLIRTRLAQAQRLVRMKTPAEI